VDNSNNLEAVDSIEPEKLAWKTPHIETLNIRDTKSGFINAGFETNFLFNQQCDFQFCQS